MPSYQFGNQENKVYFDPSLVGDRIVEVIKCEFGVTKERGDDKMTLTVRADGSDVDMLEVMVFTEKAAWKIDTFVKSANLLISGKPPKLDENIEFTEPMVVGLRGWATIGIEEFTAKDGTKKMSNKVKFWLTNKEKLAKHVADDEDDDIPFE
jgi:hypothetical protein